MDNTLLLQVGKTEFGRVGILETPMYPAVYYAGYYGMTLGVPYPKDNATHLYHRTQDEALDAALRML